jgi:hypothetical protein
LLCFRLRLWDTKRATEVSSVQVATADGAGSAGPALSWSADGSCLALAAAGGAVLTLDAPPLGSSEPPRQQQRASPLRGSVVAFAEHPAPGSGGRLVALHEAATLHVSRLRLGYVTDRVSHMAAARKADSLDQRSPTLVLDSRSTVAPLCPCRRVAQACDVAATDAAAPVTAAPLPARALVSALAPNGEAFAIAAADGCLRLVRVADGAQLWTAPPEPYRPAPRPPTARPTCLAFCGTRGLLALGFADGRLQLHAAEEGRAVGVVATGHEGGVRHVTFHPTQVRASGRVRHEGLVLTFSGTLCEM